MRLDYHIIQAEIFSSVAGWCVYTAADFRTTNSASWYQYKENTINHNLHLSITVFPSCLGMVLSLWFGCCCAGFEQDETDGASLITVPADVTFIPFSFPFPTWPFCVDVQQSLKGYVAKIKHVKVAKFLFTSQSICSYITYLLRYLILNPMDTFQSAPNKVIQTINRPVHVEAFEQEKDGVLLLPSTQTRAVRLHADKSVLHKWLPHVVQLSSIDPAKNTTLDVTQSKDVAALTSSARVSYLNECPCRSFWSSPCHRARPTRSNTQ